MKTTKEECIEYLELQGWKLYQIEKIYRKGNKDGWLFEDTHGNIGQIFDKEIPINTKYLMAKETNGYEEITDEELIKSAEDIRQHYAGYGNKLIETTVDRKNCNVILKYEDWTSESDRDIEFCYPFYELVLNIVENNRQRIRNEITNNQE